MANSWKRSRLTSVDDALRALLDLKARNWICRGQSQEHGSLFPTIDRDTLRDLGRAEKLTRKRQAIDLFRTTARFFADAGEQTASTSDVGSLLVLRHYGVPTRVLDWTLSPWVAAFFAAENYHSETGELWTFDHDTYAQRGRDQWELWPETTMHASGNPDEWDPGMPTAFAPNEPPDWFVCLSYGPGFHRQAAQQGAYSMTARFGRDHAAKIAELLDDPGRFHLYTIDPTIKADLLAALREQHGVWRGSLFPDSSGAAETAKRIAFPAAN